MDSREPPEKANNSPSQTPAPAPGDPSVPTYWHERAVPRTAEQRAELLSLRPEGWGEVLYASYLLAGKERLTPQWHDHRLELVTPGEAELSPKQAAETLERALNEIDSFLPRLSAAHNTTALKQAWGETAESADLDLIEHLATRFIEVYRDMLEWAADLRSARVPEPLQPVFRTASHLLDRPLEQIREFVDRWVAEMDEASQRLESGKTVDMILDLDLYDEQMFAAFERQTRAAAAALGRAAAPTAGQQTAGFAASFLAGYYGSKAAGHILKDIFRPIGTLMRGLGKLGK